MKLLNQKRWNVKTYHDHLHNVTDLSFLSTTTTSHWLIFIIIEVILIKKNILENARTKILFNTILYFFCPMNIDWIFFFVRPIELSHIQLWKHFLLLIYFIIYELHHPLYYFNYYFFFSFTLPIMCQNSCYPQLAYFYKTKGVLCILFYQQY